MASLVTLAKKKELPAHQFMDRETLDWIKVNKPVDLNKVDYSNIIEPIDLDTFSKMTPDASWFTSEVKVNSLHGIRHLMRVTIYAFYLSLQVQNKRDRNSVLLASLLHDIRRETDKGDEGHTNRGATWYLQNRVKVQTEIDLNEVDENLVAELIEKHELSTQKKLGLLNILKLADALDRYVQPKKKWWINEDYLEIKPSPELKAFAFDLVVESEEKYLNGLDSKTSVINSLFEMKS